MPTETWRFPSLSIEELAAPRKGSIKIGPFGSQLRKEEMVTDGVKVYGQENLIMEDWSASDRRISKSKYLSLRSCELAAGDVVVTMMGTVGRCSVFPESAEPGIMDSHLLRIQPNTTLVDRQYLRTVMAAEEVVGRQIDRLSHGTIMAGLSSSIVRRIRIPTPPVVAEQQLITVIIDALDDAIRRTEQVIAKLQQMKQGLLHDLLTRGVDNHGNLRPSPSDAPHLYKDSPLGWIPKAWHAVTIGSLVREFDGLIQTGPFGSQLHAHEYVADGVPVVMPQDIEGEGFNESRIAKISTRKAEELRRHRMQKNDAIFSRRGDLSRCASVSENQAGWLCGTGCLLVRLPAGALDAQWLAAVYRHDRVQRQVLGRAVGSTMVNLNGGILGALFVPVPGSDEQRTVVARLASLTARIAGEERQLVKQHTLKRGLLHDLLTGRVRVPLPAETTA